MKKLLANLIFYSLLTNVSKAQEKPAEQNPSSVSPIYYAAPIDTTKQDLGSSPQLDTKYGYRDLKFGMNRANIKGLKWVRFASGMQCYTRSNENKKLGEAKLSQVLLCFYKEKLSAVIVEAPGGRNAEYLQDVFIKAYGTPFENEGVLYWRGEKATALFQEDEEGEALLYIHSNILEQQKEENTKRQKDKAANEL